METEEGRDQRGGEEAIETIRGPKKGTGSTARTVTRQIVPTRNVEDILHDPRKVEKGRVRAGQVIGDPREIGRGVKERKRRQEGQGKRAKISVPAKQSPALFQ